MFWVLRPGAPWRDRPVVRTRPATTASVPWRRAGVWARIMSALTGAHHAAV
ncbi:hypothetical protein BST63_07620 [Bradyrhizobium canariense]|uniref:Transposase n=1 Tax=Bradyrhizobium canariense TaxID=255045 RepID=A0ABX3X7R6_9BRAD|nr:hypothetical protein BSR47_29485 [Bradyrhizobium canariense]OSJ32455.1 hypothetical protein BST63_07620 [Bradyrhizobium canariense]